ncbi:ACR3 family arsenite efflux transporter [Sanyastnella coralliicola]|uniref:ACR3 family arsenite efflux transporter n=1 Tax=Sanyastnella coralliicola TaxID=3069118 RepID=UPI0027B98F6B|nr:ACR3 family arsenite efflux transporter [Longitalea sp. SCSIO 12813]
MAERRAIQGFEKHLTWWVLLCIALGIGIGKLAGDQIQGIAELEVYHVNIPIAVLIWAMIFPMMVQIDFSSIKNLKSNSKGIGLTVFINWLIKPFSMALIAWLFFDFIYEGLIDDATANEYMAGAILLGAAPCTAMVFVWSYLAEGNPNYTLIQVSVNDLIMVFAFVPIVRFLLGITSIETPWNVLITSTIAFVVIPLTAGYLANKYILKTKGAQWLKERFIPKLKPVSIIALLSTLILLFAFQGEKILNDPLAILLIAIPLAIQTYLIFFAGWFGGKFLKLPYQTCAPAAMIGASNFFELAVAVAIALFGLESGAALVTVVGVLIEVPIMLSLVRISMNRRY